MRKATLKTLRIHAVLLPTYSQNQSDFSARENEMRKSVQLLGWSDMHNCLRVRITATIVVYYRVRCLRLPPPLCLMEELVCGKSVCTLSSICSSKVCCAPPAIKDADKCVDSSWRDLRASTRKRFPTRR